MSFKIILRSSDVLSVSNQFNTLKTHNKNQRNEKILYLLGEIIEIDPIILELKIYKNYIKGVYSINLVFSLCIFILNLTV